MRYPIVIVGIDPGTKMTAVTSLACSDSGIDVQTSCKLDNSEVLSWARKADADVHHVFIEGMQSYGMPVGKETFETCYLIGRILEILDSRGVKCTMVFRKDVVQHHCLTTRGKDANVRAALIERFGAVGTKKSPGLLYGISADMWSSMAIATLGYDTLNKR